MVGPSVMLCIVDDGGAQTTCRVDASAGNRNGRQMHQIHCKADGKRSKHLQERKLLNQPYVKTQGWISPTDAMINYTTYCMSTNDSILY